MGRMAADNKVELVEYKYVESNSGKSYSDFYLTVEGLEKGNYKIYAEVEWETEQEDVAVVSVYTESRVNLREDSKKSSVMNFLSEIFVDHASKNMRSIQYLSKDPL